MVDLEGYVRDAIPEHLAKKVTRSLYDRFGSLEGILSASEYELGSVSDVGPSLASSLVRLGRLSQRRTTARYLDDPVRQYHARLYEVVRSHTAPQCRMQTSAVYLDAIGRPIGRSLIAQGTSNHTPILPRQVVAGALEYNACSVAVCVFTEFPSLKMPDILQGEAVTLDYILSLFDIRLMPVMAYNDLEFRIWPLTEML
ncbi:JAB domain-containing protein [Jannaschia aquimarina]